MTHQRQIASRMETKIYGKTRQITLEQIQVERLTEVFVTLVVVVAI